MLLSYSQKVENKRLGIVAGIWGCLKWQGNQSAKPEQFEFMFLEYEDSPFDPTEESEKCFALSRSVKIYLRSDTKCLSQDTFDVLREMDNVFSVDLQDAVRKLACKTCQREEKEGYFWLENGLKLSTDNTRCNDLNRHKIRKEVMAIMSKPFILQSLINEVKADDLQEFQNSDILQKMESGDFERGQQIWIFHDKSTDWCNPFARFNPYAHVVVYVGARTVENETVHEVVHVSKSWGCGHLMKARICRQDIKEVIKPHDKVLPGHPMEEWQYSANAHQAIAARAEECVDPSKPTIVFHYDHR